MPKHFQLLIKSTFVLKFPKNMLNITPNDDKLPKKDSQVSNSQSKKVQNKDKTTNLKKTIQKITNKPIEKPTEKTSSQVTKKSTALKNIKKTKSTVENPSSNSQSPESTQNQELPETQAEKTKETIIKKPPFLFQKTQAELTRLGEFLDCPVLTYFKPPSGVIWGQDLYAILECLKKIGKQKKLALYIRSSGGQGMVSLRIINLLRSFTDRLILLAPAECASAATMIALGCDEIFMGPLSSLSPVDSSLTHSLSPVDGLNNKVPISLDELWRVLKLWQESDQQITPKNYGLTNFSSSANLTNSTTSSTNNSANNSTQKDKIIPEVGDEFVDKVSQNHDDQSVFDSSLENTKKETENPYKYLYKYVHPLVFGAVDRHSSLSLQICKEIMSYHLTDEKLINSINQKLNYDYPAHGYPITAREAKKLGLNILPIDNEMQDILNNLQLLYSEMTEEKISDYDNTTYHDNSIYSITESSGVQVTYQQNYDKFYRESEKRYITINDHSGWFKTTIPPTEKATKKDKNSTKNKNSTNENDQNESITEQIFF